MSTDLESLENLENSTDSTSEGHTSRNSPIFARSAVQLLRTLQVTTDATHQNHLYNFEVDGLGTQYTKQRMIWTSQRG